MWESVFLDGHLARAFYKSALQTSTISLISPESESEKQQLSDILRDINRSRMVNTVLAYCLLGERVYIDPPPLGNTVFFNLGDIDKAHINRNFIETWSPELSEFIEPTKSHLNYLYSGAHDTNSRERANLIASMEPLIWKSFRDTDVNFYRDDLRKCLDLLLANPSLINLRKNPDLKDFFDDEVANTANLLWPEKALSQSDIRFFAAMLYLTMTKGNVAANHVFEAQKRNALYPVHNLSLGRTRYRKNAQPFPGVSSEDITAAVGIFLDEIEWWPKLDNITQVIRLRNHSQFKEFRSILTEWADAVTRGDNKQQQKIRNDIRRANRALRRVIPCHKCGRFLTYLGIPLVLVDLFLGPIFGTPVTVCGFAIQGYADWLRRKHRWMLIST